MHRSWENMRAWLDTAHVLAQFGSKKERARALYRTFVETGVGEGKGTDLTGGGLKGRQPTGMLGIGRPAVGIAVERGETIVREKGYSIG
jgi:hypothetical protein